MSIETEIQQFSIDIEISERLAQDQPTEDLVDLWCKVGLTEYSGEQLLERVCRHVQAINHGNRRVRSHHLRGLERVAEEIERRLEIGRQSE